MERSRFINNKRNGSSINIDIIFNYINDIEYYG